MKRRFISFVVAIITASSACVAQVYYDKWGDNHTRNKFVTVSYNPMTLIGTADEFHSVAFDITGFNSISSNFPVYLDFGMGISCTFGSKDTTGKGDLKYDNKFYIISAKVPFNFGYKIDLNENCFIFPFMGVYLRGNLGGGYIINGSSSDMFSESKVGEENAFKYVQAGYSYGIKMAVGRFCMGVAYEKDVNYITYKTKAASNKISFGYRF